MADMMKKVPVREQEPKVRATNFEEVCLGYNKEEAMEEATRCKMTKRKILYGYQIRGGALETSWIMRAM